MLYRKELVERFDELLDGGHSARESMDIIAREMMYKENEYLRDLRSLIIDHGYPASEADRLILIKKENLKDIESLKESVTIAKTRPVASIPGWNELTDIEKEDMLWQLGFNVKDYNYVIDIGCYRWNSNKVECGEIVYCQERTDKEWLSLIINGCHIASDEALYHKDKDTLEVLRGNTKLL